MICPQCGAEFRKGFYRCNDCDVSLIPKPPPPPPEDHEAEEQVEVFQTSEVDLIPVIKSLLEGAEIPYLTEGESMMNLFPSDMLGGLYRPSAEVKFKVPATRADEALELLAGPFETSETPARD